VSRTTLAGAAGIIVATALVAVVLQQGSTWGTASTRPSSSQPSVLFEDGLPFAGGAGETLAGRRIGGSDEARLAAAQRLLEKARSGFAQNDATVMALDDAARRGDAALGSPAQIARKVTREVREAEQGGQAGLYQGAAGAGGQATNALHFTRGWPQAGGVMPTNFGESSDWGKKDNYYYPEQDGQTWSRSGGDSWDGQKMDVGVVGGGAKKYANGWDDESSSSSASNFNPFYWFIKGARHATNSVFPARRVGWVHPQWDSDSSYASGDEGYPSSVQEPVKKLLAIKEQRDKLKKAEDRIAQKVFSNAANGLMSGYTAGSSEEQSFVGGFLQGALQASKKSVEQQGDFAKQLDAQAQIVKQLEDIVHELEDEMRKQNWKKTADKVEEGDKEKEETSDTAVAKPTFNVEFYMEAECPACKSFATHVIPAVLNAFGDMVNLTAIPFGNAAVINGTIMCQHGPDECLGNKIELCVMDRKPKWQDWFPFFKCVEKSHDSPLNASKICLPQYGFDTDDILDCARGDKGELLHLAAAKQTLSLSPPHKWTPWIVLDGEPLGAKAGSILGTICNKLPKDIMGKIQACNPKYEDSRGETLAALDTSKAMKGYCYPDKSLTSLMMSN